MIGGTISHYHILGRLPELDRDVAIKVLPTNAVTGPAARAQLEREAQRVDTAACPHLPMRWFRRVLLPLLILAVLGGRVPAIGQKEPKRLPDVRYERSPMGAVTAMLELAGVKRGDLVYDLGCGDGRIAIVLRASSCPGLDSAPWIAPIITIPGLFCHSDHPSLDLPRGARSPRSALATAVVLLGDQFPMPSQPGLACDNGSDLRQNLPS